MGKYNFQGIREFKLMNNIKRIVKRENLIIEINDILIIYSLFNIGENNEGEY